MIVNLIGVPLFYGSDRKGADFSPNKLREKKINSLINNNNKHTVYDCGNLYIPEVTDAKKYDFHPKMKYLDPIVDVNTNLAQIVYISLKSGFFPFMIGGDHSLGLGSISGASKFYKNLAVIWLDAHGDINTDETSFSGNVHGMPLAAAMGVGPDSLTNIYFQGPKINPENVFIIGARSLDEGEVKLIKTKNLHLYSNETIKKRGIASILDEIKNILFQNNVDAVHLSFDIDCLDSSIVPGTGTPVEDGMSLEDTKYLLKYIMDTNLVKSMDLVELNTLLDKEDETIDLVLDLVEYTFRYLN